MTKAELIRSMQNANAREIVNAGAAAGLKFSERYVARIRYLARHPNAQSRAKRRRARRAPVLPLPELRRLERAESDLRRAIAEVGLRRAREILAEVDRLFSG